MLTLLGGNNTTIHQSSCTI